MARRGQDLRLLLIAVGVVVVIVGAAIGGAFYCARSHPAARIPEEEAPPTDAAPLAIPDTFGPRCSLAVVKSVRTHPSFEAGKTVEELALHRLEEKAEKEGLRYLFHGWRGREDREKTGYCRVSARYQFDDARGAAVWLIDPEEPPHARIQPQERLSVEVTKPVPWPDPDAEKAFARKCRLDGIERVKRHFSYKENYNIWRCLRKRAGEVRRDTGVEIVYNHWKSRAEGPNRCLVWVQYTEDEVDREAYFRLRYVPNEEHALEPLTPRAIEVIYGPGVFSR
jgi:hypothetical protein